MKTRGATTVLRKLLSLFVLGVVASSMLAAYSVYLKTQDLEKASNSVIANGSITLQKLDGNLLTKLENVVAVAGALPINSKDCQQGQSLAFSSGKIICVTLDKQSGQLAVSTPGAAGPAGKDGKDGQDGAVGVTGQDGAAGVAGAVGAAGANLTSIGSSVVGGISTGIMFVDSSGNLANDVANFNYDSITKKLTVTGGIDPLYFQASDISGGNAAYYEAKGGQNAAISGANTGRIRYNAVTNHFEYSENNGSYIQLGSTADVADDSVVSSKILDGTIASVDLSNGLVTTVKIQDGNVTSVKIADGAISTPKLADNSITSVKIIDGTVSTNDLADQAVTNIKLAANSVTADKIADGVITADDLANNIIIAAKLADNSVTSAKITDSTIVTADLADNSVTLNKLADNSVSTNKLQLDAITTAQILDSTIVTNDLSNNSVTAAKIAADAVTTAKIADGGVTRAKLASCTTDGYILKYYSFDPDGVGSLTAGWNCASDANTGTTYVSGVGVDVIGTVISVADSGVIAAKLADGSVLTTKLANDAVTSAKILDGAIQTADIADNGVTTVKIADSSITVSKLADSSVTLAKLTADSVDSGKIVDGTVSSVDLANGSVTSATISDGNVTGIKIADGAISTPKLADSSVTSIKIVDGTITAGDLADGSVTTAKVTDLAIDDTKLAANSVVTAKLADGSVVSSKIADGAIVTQDLADGSVTSLKITDGSVITAKLADDSVNAAKIQDAAIVNSKLAVGSIDSSKIFDGTIVFADFASNSCSGGQVIKYNGSAWLCGNDNIGSIASGDLTTANSAITITGADWNMFNAKVATTRQIVAGAGLVGGGDFSADRTLSLDIDGLSALSGSIDSSDELAVYDASVGAVRKVTRDNFLAGITGALIYQGTYNATTNMPILADVTGTKGNYYVVTTAGTQNYGSGAITFNSGDWVLHNGTRWEKLINSVSVVSVFGRTGAITAQNGDYTASNITNLAAGNISSNTVQNAINELDTEKIDKNLASGMLWIGNGSSVATAVALSGDAAITNAGVLTVAINAITGAKIADGTVATADIADSAITYAKFQNITAAKILGNATGSAAAAGEIGLGAGLVFSGTNIAIDATVVKAIGTIDSQTKVANGATIAANTLYLQTADAANIGMVSTGAQTLAGAKTFISGLSAPITGNTINGLVVNSGALSNVASLAGSGALTIVAGGTNQDVTIAPSGTGNTVLGGKVAIGTPGSISNILTVNGGISINDSTPTTTTGALYSQGGLLYWNGSKVSTGPTTGATTSNIVFTVGDNNSSGHPWKAGTWTVPNGSGGFRLNMRIYGQGQYSGGMNSQEADVIMQVNNDGSMGGQWYSVGDTNGGNAISAVSYKKIDATSFDIWVSGGQYFSAFVSVASSDGMFTPDGVTQSALPSGTVAFANQAFFNQNGAVAGFGGSVGIGTINPIAGLDVATVYGASGLSINSQGAIATKKGTDYSIGGTTVDWAPGSVSLIRLTSTTTAQTIDSISGGVDGKMLTIVNASSFTATVRDVTTATTTQFNNKIFTGTGANLSIAPNASIMMIYDIGAAKWRVVGGSGSSATTFASQNANNTLATSAFSSTQKLDAATGAFTTTLPSPTSNSGKSIEFVKTDNSVNYARIAPNVSESIGGLSSLYLYSQYDAVTLRSDGTNWQIVSDNRSSVGQSKSYLRAVKATNMTGVVNGTTYGFDTTAQSYGSSIALNSATNEFTLKAGKTYHLMTAVRTFGTAANGDMSWSLVSGTTLPTNAAWARSVTDNNNIGYSSVPGDMVYSPAVDSVIKAVITSGTAPNIDASSTYAYIEEISTPQNVISTVDYFYGQANGNVTTANTDIPIVQTSGNITSSSPYINLIAGKTYELSANMYFRGTWAEYGWYNFGGSLISNLAITGSLSSSDSTSVSTADAIITPTTNMQVKLRTGGSVSGVTALNTAYTWITVRQLGATSSTGLPMNNIIGAISSGALDNSNNAQTWNWSTMTTGTGLAMTGNSLTSGKLVDFSTNSTTGNFTGTLAGLTVAGDSANDTGTALAIAVTGSTTAAKGLSIANAGTGTSLEVQGAVAFKSGATYATPGSTNDVSLGNTSLARLDTSGIAQILTGIAGGTDGRLLTIINADTALSVTLVNQSSSSAAANRIITGTGSDITVSAGASISMVYDATDSRWRVVGGTGGSSGSSANTMQSLASTGAITAWSSTVKADATTASVIATLPTAAGNTGKLIEVVKTDNSLNTVSIAPFGSETINGASSRIYLYSQGDAVTFRSDGLNSYIVSDNRQSVGQSKSYMQATMASQSSNLVSGDHFKFNYVQGSYGSDITLDSSTAYTSANNVASIGRFTLKAGKTYRITSFIHRADYVTAGEMYTQWYNSDTGTALDGTPGWDYGVDGTAHVSSNGTQDYIFKPVVDTKIDERITSPPSNLSSISGADAYIEVISTPQNVINTVDYLNATYNGGQTNVGATTDFSSFTSAVGNIPVSSGQFALIAGKTYRLAANVQFSNFSNATGGFEGVQWVTAGNAGIGSAVPMLPYTRGDAANGFNTVEAIYTPATNTNVKLQINSGSGTANIGSAVVTIQQLGATSSTGVPLNSIIGAIGSGALDNTNYSQTWNWSTATTQNAMAINVDGLTSGSGLVIGSLSTSTTGNLLGVNSASTAAFANGGVRFNFTGAHTGNGVQIDDATVAGNALAITSNALATGNALSITSTSSGNGAGLKMNVNGVNGRGLYIATSSTGFSGSILSTTTSSAANFGGYGGSVIFEFLGAHTGTAVNIFDNTLAGNALAVNTNALTTGTSQAITSTSTGITTAGANKGSLLDLQATGALTAFTGSLLNVATTNATGNANNTGTLANISIAGAADKTIGLNIANAGQGLAMNVKGAVAFKAGNDYTTGGSTNDVAFGNTSLVRLASITTAQTITGIKAIDGTNHTTPANEDGRLLTVMNTSTFMVTLSNASNSSAVGNRILTGSGTDLTLSPDASALLQYDATAAGGAGRWRVIGGTGGANAMQSLAASGSATAWGSTIKADATSATFTATLPTAVSYSGKLIEVVKTDNSTNLVAVAPFGGQTINGSTKSIYLYSQGDSVVMRSDGSNVYVISDNRGSQSQSKSWLQARMTTTQTITTGTDHLQFNTSTQNGSSVTLDTASSYVTTANTASIGRFTLKAGKTYRLIGHLGDTSQTNYGYIWWYDSDHSADLGSKSFVGSSSGNSVGIDFTADAVFTPTVDTKVEFRIQWAAGSGTVGSYGDPSAYVEEISTPQNVTNTVDYISARRNSALTLPASTAMDVAWDTKVNGNIPLNTSTGEFTLTAGKTYKLDAAVKFGGVETVNQGLYYVWTDSAGTQLAGQGAGQRGVL